LAEGLPELQSTETQSTPRLTTWRRKHPLIGSRRLRIELLPSAPPRRHTALDQRLGLLLVATITSLPHARFSHLQPFAPHGWRAIGPAAAVLVWGFARWEAVTSLAADFRRPARDLPRATPEEIQLARDTPRHPGHDLR
jgi:hypothetical protein